MNTEKVINKAIKNSDLSISATHIATNGDITISASNGVGLVVSVVFHSGVDQDRLTITDENNEDNFAIMYPIKGNNISLARCLRMSLDEVIEHAWLHLV